MTAPLDTPLPCPFCGEAPETAVQRFISGNWYTVSCCCGDVGCNCTEDGHVHTERGGHTAAEALAKWNRRAPVRDETPLPNR